ncbi:hypothetical protein NNL21_35095 [Paenibacillus mendelii]|nr:hypothetical protein [Paenibacillus mendelii]
MENKDEQNNMQWALDQSFNGGNQEKLLKLTGHANSKGKQIKTST